MTLPSGNSKTPQKTNSCRSKGMCVHFEEIFWLFGFVGFPWESSHVAFGVYGTPAFTRRLRRKPLKQAFTASLQCSPEQARLHQNPVLWAFRGCCGLGALQGKPAYVTTGPSLNSNAPRGGHSIRILGAFELSDSHLFSWD